MSTRFEITVRELLQAERYRTTEKEVRISYDEEVIIM